MHSAIALIPRSFSSFYCDYIIGAYFQRQTFAQQLRSSASSACITRQANRMRASVRNLFVGSCFAPTLQECILRVVSRRTSFRFGVSLLEHLLCTRAVGNCRQHLWLRSSSGSPSLLPSTGVGAPKYKTKPLQLRQLLSLLKKASQLASGPPDGTW